MDFKSQMGQSLHWRAGEDCGACKFDMTEGIAVS
jgi:hypothetical protein